jgi:hypothetical protein
VFSNVSFTARLGKQSAELFMHAAQRTNLRTKDLIILDGRRGSNVLRRVHLELLQDMTHQPTVLGDTTARATPS